MAKQRVNRNTKKVCYRLDVVFMFCFFVGWSRKKKKEMAVLSTKNYSGKERNERRRYKTQQALFISLPFDDSSSTLVDMACVR